MVLTDRSRSIIKATVPLLETGGEVLTKHFYKIMLNEFPEVVPFFNKTHQASGDQPRALARAVLSYAKHIDRLDQIGPLASQIIHKHVSLNVRPDHYPIVGQCLLRAMTEVLGKETATPEVLEAWGAAYQQLADILIAAEEGVYSTNAKQEGGWRDERSFALVKKVKESEEVTSFYWRPKDGQKIMSYLPGQYIGLLLQINGQVQRRNYSLSQLPNGEEYRISVKLEPHGIVSTHLHKTLQVGDSLSFFPPVGDFTLQPSDRPLVLLAGGIGITPLLTMAEKALAEMPSRDVHLIYCTRNSKVAAFSEHLQGLVAKYPERLRVTQFHSREDPFHPRRMGKDDLAKLLPENPDVYFVGPKPFMQDMKRYLTELGVPEAQVRYEFFGPAADL